MIMENHGIVFLNFLGNPVKSERLEMDKIKPETIGLSEAIVVLGFVLLLPLFTIVITCCLFGGIHSQIRLLPKEQSLIRVRSVCFHDN